MGLHENVNCVLTKCLRNEIETGKWKMSLAKAFVVEREQVLGKQSFLSQNIFLWYSSMPLSWHHNTQHNGTQHNKIQHNDTQHNNIEHNNGHSA